VLCTHFASSALDLSAGFLLDVQKSTNSFSLFLDMNNMLENSLKIQKQILKTSFLKIKILFSIWHSFKMSFKH